MKIKNFMYLVILATSLLFISCIREQSQNMEADIETATVANAKEILQVEPIITDNSITFRLKEYTDKYLFFSGIYLDNRSQNKSCQWNSVRFQ